MSYPFEKSQNAHLGDFSVLFCTAYEDNERDGGGGGGGGGEDGGREAERERSALIILNQTNPNIYTDILIGK